MTVEKFLKSLPTRERSDAIWLLSAMLNVSRGELLLDARRELTAQNIKKWNSWWKRKLKGEPLQYICGFAPFFGREFSVNSKVLVPRPETERLAEISLELMKKQSGARVLDIGTGSGAIALTLKLERSDLEVVASDISAGALSVARKNARRLGAEEMRIEKHDLFSEKLSREEWFLVVSNPPYLEFGRDKIASNVKNWEPRMALEPGLSSRAAGTSERAAWCAQRILISCERVRPAYTALELSPRVANYLERRWKKHSSVKKIWRESDLAGRKRFLLVAWLNG